ncbi:MAG: OmpA family protein [Sporocytophaga sp.]|uniref:OmpA family protein n=1 Tax=Sporocytophaga sp. TaxID=2231183 RepID=UPI001B2E3510|nr:OmpA family protein [Sporocytophaga sp.]MBO9701989.1 OmpA family protein [Sporocytophaga sp.]
MKRLFKIYLLLVLLCVSGSAFSQTEQLIQVADEVYNFGDIKDALEIYKQVLELDSLHVKANYMAGKCYIETISKEKSLPYLLKAYDLDHKYAANILYLIGLSYHYNYSFEQAIGFYKQYIEKLESGVYSKDYNNDKVMEELKKTNRRIDECNTALVMVKNPVHVKVENLGKEINSEFPDYAPVISADQKVMFFTSRRKGSIGGNKDKDNEFFEDVYFSHGSNGKWNEAENVGTKINSKLHESSIGLSHDGKQLFVYVDNDKNKGDIFYCFIDANNEWSSPKPFGKPVNSEFIENAITISEDGNTVVFSSNRKGGKGGLDLYISTRKSKNANWSEPQNISAINSEYDDESPYITGKTLYFSSKGHEGMGGYDLFKSEFDSTSSTWSKPENLGHPINSADDDFSIVVADGGKIGYIASVKKEGFGNMDIYKVFFEEKPKEQPKEELAQKTEEKKPEEKKSEKKTQSLSPKNELFKSAPVAKKEVVKGYKLIINVYDAVSKDPLNASIKLNFSDPNAGLIEAKCVAGKFSKEYKVKPSSNLAISVDYTGYVFSTANVALNDSVITKSFYMEKIKEGVSRILRNIYFDFDKATLKSESNSELNNLYKFLTANAGVKVRIDGHTDSKGSQQYNNSLSQKRSEEVVNWLVSKGISRDRVSAKGFGESKPLASNDDEDEGRELNRRTEFVILENSSTATSFK